MTVDIDDVTLDSVQEFNISKGKSVDELDLDSKQTNFVVLGEDSSYDFEIDFTVLSKNTTKSSLESLKDKEFYEATFSYNGFNGFLAINNITLPESTKSSNLIQGSISGYFLPKPKFMLNGQKDGETTFGIAFGSGFVGETTEQTTFETAFESRFVG